MVVRPSLCLLTEPTLPCGGQANPKTKRLWLSSCRL